MPLAFEDWASPTPGPKSPLQTWLEGLFAGGPAPMQPDLVSQQLGRGIEPGQTRRPNVLPFTTDAQTGQLQLAMPRFLDILGNALPGAIPSALAPVKTAAGEKVLGTGPMKFGETEQSLEEIISGLKNAQETALKAAAEWGPPKTLPSAPKKDPFEQVPFTEQDYLKTSPPAGPSVFPADLPIATAPIKLYEDFLKNGFTLLPSEAAILNKTPEGQALVQKFADKGLWQEPTASPYGWGSIDLPGPMPLETPPVSTSPSYSKRASRLEYEDTFVGPPVPKRDLPMDEAPRLARAQELGFNTELPLYSGVPTWGELSPKAFRDPITRGKDEKGIFLTDRPEIAEYYHGGSGKGEQGVVVPAFARMQNPLEVNWTDVAPYPSFDGAIMERLINDAQKAQHDALIVRGLNDLGGPQDQFVIFNPNQLRNPWAKFDPKNIDANDLSAAIAAAFGIGGTAAALAPREKANF